MPPFDLAQRSSAELSRCATAPTTGSPPRRGESSPNGAIRRSCPRSRSYLRSDRDETVALRDLWALHVSGGLDDGTALDLLGHPSAGVRRWTIRLLGDEHRINSALRARLVALAATEPDAMTRSQLASSCQRWNADDALPILGRLIRRAEDRDDPHIPNVIWWAFERQLRDNKPAVIDVLSRPDVEGAPLVTRCPSRAGGAGAGLRGDRCRLRGLCAAAGGRARARAKRAHPGRDGERVSRAGGSITFRLRWSSPWTGSGMPPRASQTSC